MRNIPLDLKYARTHEWVRSLTDGTSEIGISDHAQHTLGDLVFVELPEIGRSFGAGEPCAVAESVKTAADVYAPVVGTVVAVNDQLRHTPELINRDPYGSGWLLRLRLQQDAAQPALLSPDEYGQFIAAG